MAERTIISMPLTSGSGFGSWIRIPLYSSLTFKMSAKKLIFELNFICLLLFEATFTSFFKDKKSKIVGKSKQQESRVFLLYLHDDRRIRIRKAQKHVDPEHWQLVLTVFRTLICRIRYCLHSKPRCPHVFVIQNQHKPCILVESQVLKIESVQNGATNSN